MIQYYIIGTDIVSDSRKEVRATKNKKTDDTGKIPLKNILKYYGYVHLLLLQPFPGSTWPYHGRIFRSFFNYYFFEVL